VRASRQNLTRRAAAARAPGVAFWARHRGLRWCTPPPKPHQPSTGERRSRSAPAEDLPGWVSERYGCYRPVAHRI